MPFTREDLESLSNALREPDWVLEKRLEAWKWFESLEIPHEKLEPWRYTDLHRLRFSFDPFTPARPEATRGITAEQEMLVKQEGDRGGYLIQRDADIVFRELMPDLAEQGIVLTDLNTAINEHRDLVQEHLFSRMTPEEDVFKALHAAFFCGGTFLYVPAGVRAALPIESQRWIDEPSSAIFAHNLVIVGDGAEISYFERFESPALDAPSLSITATEAIVGDGARFTHINLQEYGEQIWHYQTSRTKMGADSVVRSLVVSLGSRFSRSEFETSMTGSNGNLEMLGLYFAEHGQHFDFRTLQDHAAPSCESNLLYKGALKDESRTVYSGLIRVHEGAAKTDAYQANRNLVLSDHAKADSKPELEILNNDVRCTHGASVGQINKEELFYLESRGISRADAERLIVNGFFEEVVGRVESDEIRGVLSGAIEEKLS